MTLMELLLFQSLFASRHQDDIESLIEAQPAPKVFYKSYDEINFSNMVTVLAFDNKTIDMLLNTKKSHLFCPKYPLFFKSMCGAHSAVDISLNSNQIRAVNKIINYIIEHQNSFIFSYLFKDNLIQIMQKGIKVSKLLKSDIFQHTFEYELWPSIQTKNKSAVSYYNGSMFELRFLFS